MFFAFLNLSSQVHQDPGGINRNEQAVFSIALSSVFACLPVLCRFIG